MPQKIDELQLQIGSDASEAIRQLGNLAGALNTAATAAARLGGTAGHLNSFSRGLKNIADTDLTTSISNLKSLASAARDLKDKKVSINISISGASETERLKYAQADAAKSIEKDSMSIAKALGQKFHVDSKGVKEISGLLKGVAKDFGAGGNGAGIQNDIFKVIAQHGRESEAEIMGNAEEYKRFVNDFNKTYFSITGMKDLVGKGENLMSSGLFGHIRKGAESADTALVELISDFPNLFKNIKYDPQNPADMLEQVMGVYEEAKSLIEPHEIIDEGSLDRIGYTVQDYISQFYSKFSESTDKYMRDSANKIPLDLQIDQGRFEKQIQDAIDIATEKKTYKAKPIKFDLDTKNLSDSLQAAFAKVDIATLPQFAANFEKVSQSISSMNQVKIKDTGINSLVNALTRLIKVDMSKFSVATFDAIAQSIERISKVGNVSGSLHKFVSALARLAGTGENAQKAATGLSIMAPQIVNTAKAFINAGTIDKSINVFVSSLAKLASAGDNAGKTASGLSALSTAVLSFLSSLQNAPQISESLAMTIQGLGNLAAAGQNAGKALSDIQSAGSKGNSLVSGAMNSTVSSLKKLLNVSLQLGKQGASALGTFMQRLGLLPGHVTSINRAAISFSNLLRAVLPFYGLRGMFNWAQEAVATGSSLVEIENVIDTAFGDLKKGYEDVSGYVYKWAQGTIDAFGVSEIAAKQYTGRLMSMFNSSGFDITEGMRDSAAKMSTDLIERAGDIASFYDISVDEAMTKIHAGLAGMTRPLRSIGINMSVANLEAFAMSKGIRTSWQEMDQATQMALRYQYILDASQYAMGDFSRTSGTYANQVRLLSLNFQQLSATIGQGLISAIAPVISWLNTLIRRLVTAANVFRAFMATLFGKAIGAAKGVADDMATYLDDASGAASDLGSSAGGASDGLGGASDAAKELKKNLTVLPFDELNQLAKDTSSASSGGSGGGGGGGGLGGVGDLGLSDLSNIDIDSSPTIQAISRWAARIREAFQKGQWSNLGRIVAEGINAGFKYIYDILDWNKIKPKVVDGFITPFQTAFNSMMKWIDWTLIGNTLGRGLNTITYTLRAWITGFEWKNYGADFANGMNAMLNTVDADAVGRLIADKFKAAWDFFAGWVSTFDFALFGQKLKEGIRGAIDELNPAEMGESLGTFITGIGTTLKNLFKDGTVAKDTADAFNQFVNGFLKKFDAKEVLEGINSFTTSITTALVNAIKGIDKSELVESLTTVLVGLDWGVIGTALAIKTASKLAGSLFGAFFKQAAKQAITNSLSGLTITDLAVAALKFSAITLAVGAITIGGIELGTWIDKKLRGIFPWYGGAADSQKNAKSSGATGNSTSYSDFWKNFGQWNPAGVSNQDIGNSQSGAPKSTSSASSNQMTLTGKIDKSFTDLLVAKAALIDNPVVRKLLDGALTKQFSTSSDAWFSIFSKKETKTVDGTQTGQFKSVKQSWTDWISEKILKTTDGTQTNSYKSTKTDWKGWVSGTITKSAAGSLQTSYSNAKKDWKGWIKETITKSTAGNLQTSYSNAKKDWKGWVSGTITKTAKGTGTKGYWDLSSDYKGLKSKTINVHVTQSDAVYDLSAYNAHNEKMEYLRWEREHAVGGLFTGPVGLEVFGEAGAEAVLPLTSRRSMQMVGNAIASAGGMSTGNNSDLADAIAARILPAVASIVSGQAQRPVNVNATLYTEDNEVLARAVNSGNKSLDKRYHPVAQYSY